MSKIYLINGESRTAIAGFIYGKVRDALDTENTMELTLYGDDALSVNGSTIVEYNGNYYDVVSIEKYMNGFTPLADVFAESILYRSNDPQYNYGSQMGKNASSLADLFNWWCVPNLYEPHFEVFLLGLTDLTSIPYIAVYADAGMTRRAALNRIASHIGAEIEVSGYTLNFWQHRGSVTPVELLDKQIVTSLRIKNNIRDGLVSYDVGLSRRVDLNTGDNVHIVFTPLNVDIYTRIIAMEYNPYNPREVMIEVGDRELDIKDILVSRQ